MALRAPASSLAGQVRKRIELRMDEQRGSQMGGKDREERTRHVFLLSALAEKKAEFLMRTILKTINFLLVLQQVKPYAFSAPRTPPPPSPPPPPPQLLLLSLTLVPLHL